MADRIRKINTTTGDTTKVLALSSLPSGANIKAIDASFNVVYAVDYDKHVVYKIFEDGRIEGVLIGELGTSGNVDSRGIGTSTGLTARTTNPLGICVDRSDNIYIGSHEGVLVRRLSTSGRSREFVGNSASSGRTVAGLDDNTVSGEQVRLQSSSEGNGMDVDRSGIVYRADTANNCVVKFWNSGKSTVLAGGASANFANGVGNAALFNTPTDVCVDNHGTVYVADYGNNRVRKITESGIVTTLAGTGSGGSQDGNGLVATFNGPSKIEIDDGGQFLYVMDYANAAIRRVDSHGTVTTFSSFNAPVSKFGDISVDRSGFLYILENDS